MRRLEEDKRFTGNFLGLALTFRLHHKAPQGTVGVFIGFKTRNSMSTTNPPGLLLVAPGMKNQLSHRGTNTNLKDKKLLG